MSEDLHRLVTREAALTPNVILFRPVEMSPEAESNADELFDKCGNIEGVITDRCGVSDCRGSDVSCRENEEDFCSSWEELVDFSDALFCVSSVAMGTAFSDVEYVELTRRAEVSSDFSMPVIRYVEETVPDIFVDVRLLSCRVPSAGAYASKGVLM